MTAYRSHQTRVDAAQGRLTPDELRQLDRWVRTGHETEAVRRYLDDLAREMIGCRCRDCKVTP